LSLGSFSNSIIQFGSLELVVLPIFVPTTLVEAKAVPNIPNGDDEGWIPITRWRLKKQRHIQPLPLRRRKRHNQKRNPRCPKGEEKV